MSSSNKSAKPKSGRAVVVVGSNARPPVASGGTKPSGGSGDATRRAAGTSVKTSQGKPKVDLKKQMERLKRSMEREKVREKSTPSKSAVGNGDANRAALTKQVSSSKLKPSRVAEGARPKTITTQPRKTNPTRGATASVVPTSKSSSNSGKFMSRINSKSDLIRTDDTGLHGVPTRKARIINSTPKKTSTPNDTPKSKGHVRGAEAPQTEHNSDDFLSESGQVLSPIAAAAYGKRTPEIDKLSAAAIDGPTTHRDVGMESASPKKDKLTKQDKVSSTEDAAMLKASINSDLDTSGDNILAVALARLGDKHGISSSGKVEEEDLRPDKVSLGVKFHLSLLIM